ncbi:hypothetical protein [Treponema putidum]|uniref:hypothetical protein n=1 Tax=Treponema putidum TaxID=221027 RepID=UPI002107D21A|nr:hypothetical protein [Treponema putidum]UTY31734.1 hypothetical protein E4N75_09745 [Treponema putidum]
MKIYIKDNSSKTAKDQAAQKESNKRYGVWGTVTDVNSMSHCVDVKLSSGVELKEVPVACTDEWVCEYKDYVSGSRNLPPQGSRVFLFMPTASFESAFVLCSGLSRYEKQHEKAFMADKSDRDKKNKVREKVFPGKWKEEYEYDTGRYKIISPNESIKIDIKDDDEKEVKVEAFGTELKIDKDGNIDVKVANGKKLNLNGDNFSGLVKADELISQLQKNTAILNGILGTLKAPITEAGNGAPGAFQGALMTAIGALQTGDFSNIKNDKVLHGG